MSSLPTAREISPNRVRWFSEEVQPHEPMLRAWLQARFPSLTDNVGDFDRLSVLEAPTHRKSSEAMTAKFAYLAATMNLWKEPYILEATRPLDLRYGVALWDGKVDQLNSHDRSARLYRDPI